MALDAGGFLAPFPLGKKSSGVSFSSDDEDDEDSSRTSTLASPLQMDFSEDEAEKIPPPPRRSKRNSNSNKRHQKLKFEEPLKSSPLKSSLRQRGPRRFLISQNVEAPMSAPTLMGPPATQSTPKTSAAQRFKSRYAANSTPNFSPKKRLDFDSFSYADDPIDGGSPRLKPSQAVVFEVGTPSSSRSATSTTSDNNNAQNGSFNSEAADENDPNSVTIKPISLASKFDCFSDSD
jgi:hypothetical protein